MKKFESYLPIFLLIIFIISLIFLLYWRLFVAQTRYLDIDEFTHMNWSASIARGEKPYVDFFTFFTPGMHLLYSLVFKIQPADASVFLLGRYLSLGIFICCMLCVGYMFSRLRNWKFAILAMCFFAWLPMPYDKLIEIRPDNLSLLFLLLGNAIHIYLLTKQLTNTKKQIFYTLIGVCYGLSIIALVKILPMIAFSVCCLLLSPDIIQPIKLIIKNKKIPTLKVLFSSPFASFIGMTATAIVFFVYLLSLGDLPKVLYSLLKLPFESSHGLSGFFMEPHLFFFMNEGFYGSAKSLWPMYMNHAAWFFAIIIGAFRLFTPFLSAENYKHKSPLAEFLTAGLFFLSCFLYIEFYPLKHTQYLIPVSVYIAFYAADSAYILYQKIKSSAYGIPVILLAVLCLYIFIKTTLHIQPPKLGSTIHNQIQETNLLKQLIPLDQKVLDFEGRTIFWKPAYYICCLPFGHYAYNLSFPPEPLYQVLEKEKPQFIFQGYSNRVTSLYPTDYQYIYEHYEAVYGWNNQLFKRKP